VTQLLGCVDKDPYGLFVLIVELCATYLTERAPIAEFVKIAYSTVFWSRVISSF